MSTSARAKGRFASTITACGSTWRTVAPSALPLAWYPRLSRATPGECEDLFISPSGLHWETIDEDISIAGILAGRMDRTAQGRAEAA